MERGHMKDAREWGG